MTIKLIDVLTKRPVLFLSIMVSMIGFILLLIALAKEKDRSAEFSKYDNNSKKITIELELLEQQRKEGKLTEEEIEDVSHRKRHGAKMDQQFYRTNNDRLNNIIELNSGGTLCVLIGFLIGQMESIGIEYIKQ
jgi:hypothetical protein